MVADQGVRERERLVDRLVREFDLRGLAAAAAARYGVPARAEAVAYCVVVLVRKQDPARRSSDTGELARTYRLDPSAPDFVPQLERWADTVARNLAQWESTYTTIQDEADSYDVATLRDMIRTDRGEDVIDMIAEHLAAVLGNCPRIEAMTLARLIEYEPAGNEYAFRSPLSQWVRTSAGRRLGHFVTSLEARTQPLEGGDVIDDAERELSYSQMAFRELIAMVAELADTRADLRDALELADRWETSLATQRPTSREAASALAIVRAHLAYVVDELVAERRAVPGMLAYVVLALRDSDQRQGVVLLSLRLAWIDPAVVMTLTQQLRGILRDPLEPKPVLVQATRRAAANGSVPAARVRSLEQLAGDPEQRARVLAPVDERLDRLPGSVSDLSAIAELVGSTYGVVKTQRSAAHKELEAVNQLYARTFRRYAMQKSDDEH